MTPLYKKARLYVQKYNCAQFAVSMYNSVREKWRTNLLVKKKKKKKKGKKERKKEIKNSQRNSMTVLAHSHNYFWEHGAL